MKGAEKRDVNSEIAEIFYEMADIFEIQDIKWKPQAYRIAAQTLESLSESVSSLYREGGVKELEELPGIGKGLAKKIIQYLKNGKIDEHEKLKKSIPAGIYGMMQIPGIGGKKASLFYHKLKIKSVKELEKAAKSHKLIGMPGFKEKAEEKILEGIEIMKGQKGRMLLAEAERISKPILNAIKKIQEVKEAVIAGSFRRKKPTIGDLDILVRADNKSHKKIMDLILKMKFVDKILGKGEEKSTIITSEGLQIDVRVFNDEEFGAGLLYFTGDKQHNIWLRKIAIKKGWKLNEYGLFDKNGKRIAGKNEMEIYDLLGVKFVNPEKRIGELRI